MDKAELIRATTGIILKHARPTRIWLYGSHASGEAEQGSDIDIAFLDENHPPLEAIQDEIDALPALVKIDVHNLAGADQRFVNRVQSTGRVLYSADRKLRAEDGLYNYSNALQRFEQVVRNRDKYAQDGYGDIVLDLAVKRFEFTFEMAWKATKRYLEYLGLACASPRACFKEAYAQGLLEQETVWLDMIEMRNRSSHIYDESEISEILERLDDYLAAFLSLKQAVTTGLA